MDTNDFWSLIRQSYETANGDIDVQVELLVKKLVEGTVEEILAYDAIFQCLLDQSNIATLWDAADIIGCGCGNDDFRDFRGWLIAHGKEIYENAISDPEILVDLVKFDERARHEEFLYVSIYAHERKMGSPYFHRKEMRSIEVKGVHEPEKESDFLNLQQSLATVRKDGNCFHNTLMSSKKSLPVPRRLTQRVPLQTPQGQAANR